MFSPVLFCAAALAGLAAAVDEPPFAPRSFDGWGNNEDNPEWGAAGTSQVRRVFVLRLYFDVLVPFLSGKRL